MLLHQKYQAWGLKLVKEMSQDPRRRMSLLIELKIELRLNQRKFFSFLE